jgi:hypothetical protein
MSWMRSAIFSAVFMSSFALAEQLIGPGHAFSMLLGALLAFVLLVLDTAYPERSDK